MTAQATAKHKATKVEPGKYEYRGIRIWRNDEEKGHWGHWSTSARVAFATGYMARIRAATMKGLLENIDRCLDAKGE